MSQISSVEYEPYSPISISSNDDLPTSNLEQHLAESYDHDQIPTSMIESKISQVQSPQKNKRIGI